MIIKIFKDIIFVIIIMSSTFIEDMREIANDKTLAQQILDKEREEKEEKFRQEQEKVKHELFLKLSKKYYSLIAEAIRLASLSGRTYKYMNFYREDFKANFPGVGNPVKIEEEWLNELCKEGSQYIPFGGRCLNGLKFSIWNNRSFTTLLSWE